MGVLMYSLGYMLVYHAERHVISGLLAVAYSASPLLAMIGMERPSTSMLATRSGPLSPVRAAMVWSAV